MTDINENGITPWNYTPADPTTANAGGTNPLRRLPHHGLEGYGFCNHQQPAPKAEHTGKPITLVVTEELQDRMQRQSQTFFESQPHLFAYLDALRVKLSPDEHGRLLGTAVGISNRLAREGKRLELVLPPDIATATTFADEVVFGGPVVCLCRHRHGPELRRLWGALKVYPEGCRPRLLFRYIYIVLEVLEHVAQPGYAPVFDYTLEEEPPADRD